MLAYALGWGLTAYLVIRALALLTPPVIRARLATWAIYAASAVTIAKLLGF
ncbi:hypothetical protein [Streptomyces odonnellii]|uniref:hypothetical protein n=1 Tax=Streptomyces odonnellii TaxID=1417980 RepID=UPI000A934560|nr:hypothetical protein [Streptomyces odonnellii]